MHRWQSGLMALFVVAVMMGLGVNAWAEDKPEASEAQDVILTAQEAGTFETFLRAVEAAELTETLQAEGPFTVFAPTDAAFAKLPEGELEWLLQPENKEQLRALLLYHVAPELMFIDYAVAAGEVTTLQGQPIQVTADEGKVWINGESEVIDADILASNGMLHAIDTVLQAPPEEQQ